MSNSSSYLLYIIYISYICTSNNIISEDIASNNFGDIEFVFLLFSSGENVLLHKSLPFSHEKCFPTGPKGLSAIKDLISA